MVWVRLHNGLGWVDAASARCAMPPDGKTFAMAPGVAGSAARVFHVVAAPQLVAVLTIDAQDPLDERERARIETLLGSHVDHVAFLRHERLGAGVVEGQGARVVLATAAAALKAIGGWDESVPLFIESNGKMVAVRLSFDGRRWHADASEVTP